MANSRVFKILNILVERKFITAGELSSIFGVSTRTIYRDIETLLIAGVPIYCDKGNGGGIRIAKNYLVDAKNINKEERNIIMTSIQKSVPSISEENRDLLSKVESLFEKSVSDWIEIDFNSYGKFNQRDKDVFNSLKKAILNKRIISFSYYGAYGIDKINEFEPLRLVYKSGSWFLFGYLIEKMNTRSFKVRRMREIQLLEKQFERSISGSVLPANQIYENSGMRRIKLRISSDMGYRAYDEFDGCKMMKDGSIEVDTEVSEGEWLLETLLSYGSSLKVIAPQELKDEMREKIKAMMKIYNKL